MLVLANRKTLGDEPGDVLVDVDVMRSGRPDRCRLYLKAHNECYEVINGDRIALDLHSVGNRVKLQPVERNDGYTHIVIGID
jgi:hypothetical protein